MKVSELRALIAKSDAERIQKAFVECYKQLSKAQKEETDLILEGILTGKEIKKTEKAAVKDYDALVKEINTFLENAYEGNYYAPNRVIPKNQRPKWRFLVKGYIKTLGEVSPQNEFFGKTGEYLMKLYQLLADACSVYLFSTEDAFRSVGITQEEFFRITVDRVFANQGMTKNTVKSLLWQAASGGLSRESIHDRLIAELITFFRTEEEKHLAIDAAKELIQEKNMDLKGVKRGGMREYQIKEGINETGRAVLWIATLLGDLESEMGYYFKNSMEFDKEIALYCGLRILEYYIGEEGWEEDWIRLYEYAVKKEKVKPREELRGQYQEMKQKL